MSTPTPVSCANPTCGKSPATQRCPTCRDLGVPESLCHFCSKECFQGTWEEHKKVHRHFKELALSTLMSSCPWRSRFEGYRFTGPLRAFLVTPQMKVPEGLACPDYSGDGRPRSELLERGKQFNIAEWTRAEDVKNLRRAGAIAREVTDIAAGLVRPGVTGDEIDKAVFAACVERGAYPSPLNYRGFPKSVCISVNEVICHGIPDTRPLQDGDIVNLDVTVYYKGFHADMNETYTVGQVDAAGRKLVKCAYDCLAAAMALCKPGVFYRDLGAAISRIADAQGFSVVRNYTGHGVGALFHTSPNIPHYKGNRAQGVMKVGHVFTIEPMINEGVHEDEQWPDDWTVVTADGRRSAQFEHTMMVTETGVEILTARAGASRTHLVWDEEYVSRPRTAAKEGGASSSSSSSSSSSTTAAASSSKSAKVDEPLD